MDRRAKNERHSRRAESQKGGSVRLVAAREAQPHTMPEQDAP